MTILDTIKSPDDLKRLDSAKLPFLAREIREFLIRSVSKTGGHLASNLGVVELTLCLHRVFSTPRDKIVWDVGHQTYTHKLLTGRKACFSTLRSFGGISGFPKACESEHDCFNTGHSSTSVSAALGIAKARDQKGEDFSVVAVIGDGALTGGLAYEGLNNAGRMKRNFIVVLNDNEMSISKNVGGISRYLNKLRSAPSYFKAKQDIDSFLTSIPIVGESLARQAQKTKDSIRYLLVEGSIFEDLGFTYFGPIDGHNIPQMEEVFRRARNVNGPVLLHVYTKKGKGYSYAETSPQVYHGVSCFDVDTGRLRPGETRYLSSSGVFAKELCALALEEKSLSAITAAMPDGTGLSAFSRQFPDRFYDVGIAEGHAVTFAAGLATEGIIPVVAVYSTFLQRAYDQLIHDVALQGLHVVFAIDRSGLVGEDGETHHGVFDLSYLCAIPGMSVLAPATPTQLRQMLRYAVRTHRGPVAVRYHKTLADIDDGGDFVFGRAEVVREGKDITLVAVGNMLDAALRAASLAACDAQVIDLRSVKPLDVETLSAAYAKTGRMLVVEDHVMTGGAGSLIECALGRPVAKIAFGDEPVPHGSYGELYRLHEMDAEGIARRMEKECGR